MARPLPKWCKEAQKKLIDEDMSVRDLANKIGMSRQYTSSIVNGRAYSEIAIKAISNELNIQDSYT